MRLSPPMDSGAWVEAWMRSSTLEKAQSSPSGVSSAAPVSRALAGQEVPPLSTPEDLESPSDDGHPRLPKRGSSVRGPPCPRAHPHPMGGALRAPLAK